MTTDPRASGSVRGWSVRRLALFAGLALLSALLLTSCGPKNADSLHPVQGRVLYKDKPATGAKVVFHPLGDSAPGLPLPQATVEADGAFRLSTRTQHDGAAPGKYAVTVSWPSDGKKEEDGTAAGPDRLGGRYANPKTTPLRAEVGSSDNQLEPFVVR